MNWSKIKMIKTLNLPTWSWNQCIIKRTKANNKFPKTKMTRSKIRRIHKRKRMMKMKKRSKKRLKMPEWSSKWVRTSKSSKSFKWPSTKPKTLTMLWLTQTECSKEKLRNLGKRITSFWIRQEKPQWTNISIWTFWPKFIKPESSSSKLRTGTTECHLSFKINLTKNSQSAMKSDQHSKIWNDKLPEKPLTADLISQSRLIKYKSGNKGKHKLLRNFKI